MFIHKYTVIALWDTVFLSVWFYSSHLHREFYAFRDFAYLSTSTIVQVVWQYASLNMAFFSLASLMSMMEDFIAILPPFFRPCRL